MEEIDEQVLDEQDEQTLVELLVLEELEEVEEAAPARVVAEQVAHLVGDESQQLGLGEQLGELLGGGRASLRLVGEQTLGPHALAVVLEVAGHLLVAHHVRYVLLDLAVDRVALEALHQTLDDGHERLPDPLVLLLQIEHLVDEHYDHLDRQLVRGLHTHTQTIIK